MSGRGSSRPLGRLRRYATAPLRALRRARDLYVETLAGFASRSHRRQLSAAMQGGRTYVFRQPRAGAREDVGDLVRSASTRLASIKAAVAADGGETPVPRSQSVAAMRIDEEMQCSFEGDHAEVRLGMGSPFPRSRSCAVGPRRSAADTGTGFIVGLVA